MNIIIMWNKNLEKNEATFYLHTENYRLILGFDGLCFHSYISEFSNLNCILSFILHETLKVKFTMHKRQMN